MKDYLGSTRAVVDDAGNSSGNLRLLPVWGSPGRTFTTANTMEKFTGKERDDALNLDYFGARYYDAALGRWQGADPAADLQESISPYAYSLNSPINFTDPDGSLPIYINGRVGHSSERGNSSYWDSNLLATIKSSGIPNPGGTREFIDGDRYWSQNRYRAAVERGGWLTGNMPGNRRLAGKIAARSRFSNILSQLERDPESGLITEKIQIYTHSCGAAFGAGFTNELMSLIKENADQFSDSGNVIDFVLNLAPHQSWAIDSPDGVNAYSMNHTEDPLSDNSMEGLNAAFSSSTGNGFGSGHNNGSFSSELGAFLKSFMSAGTSQGAIDSFIQRAKDEYGIDIIVRQ